MKFWFNFIKLGNLIIKKVSYRNSLLSEQKIYFYEQFQVWYRYKIVHLCDLSIWIPYLSLKKGSGKGKLKSLIWKDHIKLVCKQVFSINLLENSKDHVEAIWNSSQELWNSTGWINLDKKIEILWPSSWWIWVSFIEWNVNVCRQ